MSNPSARSIIIIGAGVAGLSTGIFAQRNGYSTQIFEMHTLPGGLMTSWKRKGYTIDGCIHWLTGSSQKSGYYKLWQDIGILQPDSQVINPDIFTMFEANDGTKVFWYCNIDRFEKHLLEMAPADTKLIRTICKSARQLVGFDQVRDYSISPLELVIRNIKAFPENGKCNASDDEMGKAEYG